MKIGTKERLLTVMVVGVIGAIALIVWRTYAEVDVANRERQQVSEVARGLSQLRLLTFEYRLFHNERSRLQWNTVSDRVDQLLARVETSTSLQDEILARIRERRIMVRRIFAEIAPEKAGGRPDGPLDASTRLFEAQLLSRILVEQQDNFSDIFRLTDIATKRISDVQLRLMQVVIFGLALVAILKILVSWLLNRDVLYPVARLQAAAQQVAAGNRNIQFAHRADDEIGELSNNFNAMTRSLHAAMTQVERSNQQLATTNAELESFSYSVSHDLRGPLRSMDGFALVLLEDYADKLGQEGKDSLERIRAASQRMGELIDDLLRLSQVTRAGLVLAKVDLSAMARNIASALDKEQPGRSVDWTIEPGLGVHADPALMQIAMQNLLQNAWKFTSRTARPSIRIGAMERDGGTAFFVADNGVGFDMEYAQNLFGAFQRLHYAGDFPGTGIGLAIVQRIIHRHMGEIWAEAKKGEGATFFFRIKDLDDVLHGHDNSAG